MGHRGIMSAADILAAAQRDSRPPRRSVKAKRGISARQLSPRQRDVYTRVHSGQTYEQVASELKITYTTVCVHLHRARAKLGQIGITGRIREVWELALKGETEARISEILQLSPHTIDAYMTIARAATGHAPKRAGWNAS